MSVNDVVSGRTTSEDDEDKRGNVLFSYLPGNLNQIADQLSRLDSSGVTQQPLDKAIMAIDRPSEQEI